jgi:hypothetical protein
VPKFCITSGLRLDFLPQPFGDRRIECDAFSPW